MKGERFLRKSIHSPPFHVSRLLRTKREPAWEKSRLSAPCRAGNKSAVRAQSRNGSSTALPSAAIRTGVDMLTMAHDETGSGRSRGAPRVPEECFDAGSTRQRNRLSPQIIMEIGRAAEQVDQRIHFPDPNFIANPALNTRSRGRRHRSPLDARISPYSHSRARWYGSRHRRSAGS
jgi:hypothetical protein